MEKGGDALERMRDEAFRNSNDLWPFLEGGGSKEGGLVVYVLRRLG